MGVKGKLAWTLKIDKVAKPLFQATYRELMNTLIQTCDNIEEVNRRMKEIGFRVGQDLLMEYADKIRKHASTFVEFSKTLQLAYKVNSGQEFTDVWISEDGRVIKYTDDHCVLCEGVEIRDMPGLQYCGLISGVFQAVMDLRGFKAEAYQESCRAIGDSTCRWTIRLLE